MENPEYFNICVTVLEANELLYTNFSSLACVEVGNEKKYTKVVKNNTTPFYNEYFVFELKSKFSLLMSTCINFKIFEARKWVRLLVGSIQMEVATVWTQPDHRLKSSLALTIPSDISAKVRGYLNCEIAIKTDSIDSFPKISSWVVPDVLGSRRAKYMVHIYDCVGLEIKDIEKVSEISVKVSFAGRVGHTTSRLQAKTVQWNEQITFIDFYPPLFQKMIIYLYDGKKVLASKSLYLSDISSSSGGGYLPSFGPTYAHLYVKEYVYCGSILLAIEAEYATLLTSEEAIYRVITKSVKHLKKETIGQKETFLCYGGLFDAVILQKSLAQPHISISMSLGFGRPSNEKNKETEEPENVTDTPRYKARLGNTDFVYLSLYEQKPFVFVYSEWPNTHFRLTNSNILDNLVLKLKNGIDLAMDLIAKSSEDEARMILRDCLNNFKVAHSITYLQQLTGVTLLDIERIKVLSNVFNKLSSINIRRYNIEDLISKCNSFVTVLETLCEDIQECLPSIVVSFKSRNRVIAYSKLHPRQIFFSRTELKRGTKCGKINTLHLLNSNQVIIGRVDIWLWLGFKDQVSSCLQLLPPGHEDIKNIVSLPTTLTYTSDKTYTAICYIYGGLVAHKIDSPDLCNPSIRIFFCNQSRETYAIMRTLAPLWKETFTFPKVQLYPNTEYIKDNPPVLSLELWDQSSTSSTLVGITFVIPKVRHQPITLPVEYELQWFKLDSKSKILAVFEIIELSNEFESKKRWMTNILPKFIEPSTVSYRMEIVFWGIRPFNLERLKGFTRLQAIIQWGPAEIKSNIIGKVSRSQNFKHKLEIVQIELPDVQSYAPPIVLHVMSLTSYIGFDIDNNVHQYVYKFPSKVHWMTLVSHRKSAIDRARGRHSTPIAKMPDLIPLMDIDASRRSYEVDSPLRKFITMLIGFFSICKPLFKMFNYVKKPFQNRLKRMTNEEQSEVEDYDWWCNYYFNKVVKYANELEKQPEFFGFNDVFKSFSVKQRKSGKLTQISKLKAMILLYQWPVNEPKLTLQGQDPEAGVLKHTILSDKVKVLVRVYCIKAHNLQPSDVNGKSDPYIEIRTASSITSDKTNFIARQLNPVFGKCYEITATFPVDSILAVRIMDWDMFTSHDLIGETFIDIENRYYSKYRATCGLSAVYTPIGCHKWRDIENPTVILEKLCNMYNLPLPKYLGKTIIIGSKEFVIDHKIEDKEENEERLALLVLRHWNEVPIVGHVLVPEHVETRSLFHTSRPGIERGKLEMWVDLFDLSMGPVPPPVDISPRKPQKFELRVIIWNTEKVPLVDDSYFVGRKHTDIFVKGWLGDPDSVQSTDVHYTSVTGEGNFNWRFIFPFEFIEHENKMVIFKRDNLEFSKTEYKVPPLLHLQVWDSDRISADDFIGSLVLDLNYMPRGARTRRGCKVYKVLTPVNSVDMFKVKRLRGWWPFLRYDDGKNPKNAGFLEADFQLLTIAEAIAYPVGLGRAGPAALPPPMRPEFQYRFWLAPLRIIVHYIFGIHKGKATLFLVTFGLVFFVLIAFYSLPFLFMKKLLGV